MQSLMVFDNSSMGFSLHGKSCPCCNDFIDGRDTIVKTFTTKVKKVKREGMSGDLDFITDLFDPVKIFNDIRDAVVTMVNNVINTITKTISDCVMGIINAVQSIDWNKVVSDLGKIAGNIMVYTSFQYWGHRFLSEFPLTSHLYNEFEKLSGGVGSTMSNISTLAGRVTRGDAITKKEFIEDALFMVKIAAIYFAGPAGSAAYNTMLVSQTCAQLRNGTLGQTQLGRDILGVAAVAGTAYAIALASGASATDAATQALADRTEQEAVSQGQNYLLTKTPLGQGDLGPFLAGAVTTFAVSDYHGTDAFGDFRNYSNGFVRQAAIVETAEQIGGPYASQIASATVDAAKDGKFNPANISWDSIPNGYSMNQFLTDMQNGYGDVKNSIVNYMNSEGGQVSFPNIDFSKAGDLVKNVVKEVARVPENVVDIVSNIHVPTISSPEFPGLSVPDIKAPDFSMSAPNIDWDILNQLLMFGGLKALLRKKNIKGKDGKNYTVYVMEDGSLYYVVESNSGLYMLLAGAALAVGSQFT